MAAYTYLIDQMTWSYSRIKQYEKCKYGFLLKYIFGEVEEPMFYSSFGSFAHELIADFYGEQKAIPEILVKFTTQYDTKVLGKAQNEAAGSIFKQQLLSYVLNMRQPKGKITDIERKFMFNIGPYKFTAIADMIEERDSKLLLIDHKSHRLKPFTKRAVPTKSDLELSDYLKQLYLYSFPVNEAYGRLPDVLAFNCYRFGEVVEVDFDNIKYAEAIDWILNKIEEIRKSSQWEPCLDYFTCKYLCGMGDKCEYYSSV